jgi:hypothetical protein
MPGLRVWHLCLLLLLRRLVFILDSTKKPLNALFLLLITDVVSASWRSAKRDAYLDKLLLKLPWRPNDFVGVAKLKLSSKNSVVLAFLVLLLRSKTKLGWLRRLILMIKNGSITLIESKLAFVGSVLWMMSMRILKSTILSPQFPLCEAPLVTMGPHSLPLLKLLLLVFMLLELPPASNMRTLAIHLFLGTFLKFTLVVGAIMIVVMLDSILQLSYALDGDMS